MIVIDRTDEKFAVIQRLSNESFEGIERPPDPVLRWNYDHCELFTHEITSRFLLNNPETVAYAIVTMEGGLPYIWHIVTHKSFRHQGFASSLLKEIIAWGDTWCYDRIDLTVNSNNPAQKLYFDFGFRVIRVLPKFYGKDSGLRMRRML